MGTMLKLCSMGVNLELNLIQLRFLLLEIFWFWILKTATFTRSQLYLDPGISYDEYNIRTTVSSAYWSAVSASDEPGSYRRFRAQGHRHFRKLKYIFEDKECAYFPRSLLGSSIQPINVFADDDVALVVAPISMIEGELSPEAAAPESDEVNPLAIVPYEGPNSGADDHVNGGGLSDVE